MKKETSIRLSEEADGLRERLAAHHGVSKTAVIEMALRRMAREDLPAKKK